MAWFQQYESWAKYVYRGTEFFACPCYIWSDGTLQYYRHWVYYPLNHVIAGLNTQDYFYFKDADANGVIWCRCRRGESAQLRWSYLLPKDHHYWLAMLRDSKFLACEAGRPLSIAGAKPPPDQPVDLAFTQQPPPDLPVDAINFPVTGVVLDE